MTYDKDLSIQALKLSYRFAIDYPKYQYLFGDKDDYAMSLTTLLLSKIQLYDSSKSSFGTFAYIIFIHYVIEQYKRSKRLKYNCEECSLDSIMFSSDTEPKLDEFSYNEELYDDIVNDDAYTYLYNKLEPYLSKEFIDHYAHGKSYQEIARDRHVSKQAVGLKVIKEKQFIDNYIKTRQVNTNSKRLKQLANALDEIIPLVNFENLLLK